MDNNYSFTYVRGTFTVMKRTHPRLLNGLSNPNGHGTEMAGIVAAETGNGDGIAGVGFGGVKIMPVTVLGADGTGQDRDVIEGVVYAAEHGADVILMSFSNPGYSEMLQAAIDYAWDSGAVLVAATGNDGATTPQFPAGDAGVIGVSAIDSSDGVWGASNTGDDVFLAAPGARSDDLCGRWLRLGDGYLRLGRTVTGAAALLKADSGASNGVIVDRWRGQPRP